MKFIKKGAGKTYMSSDDERTECETEEDWSPFVRDDAEKVADEALSDIYPCSICAGGSFTLDECPKGERLFALLGVKCELDAPVTVGEVAAICC